MMIKAAIAFIFFGFLSFSLLDAQSTSSVQNDYCEYDLSFIPEPFILISELHPEWWDRTQHTPSTLTDIFQATAIKTNAKQLVALRQNTPVLAALLNTLQFNQLRQEKGLDLAFLSQTIEQLEYLEGDWRTLNFSDWAILTQNVRHLLEKGNTLSKQELNALTSFESSTTTGKSILMLCKKYIDNHQNELLQLLHIQ